jgi:hypothetical protein
MTMKKVQKKNKFWNKIEINFTIFIKMTKQIPPDITSFIIFFEPQSKQITMIFWKTQTALKMTK